MGDFLFHLLGTPLEQVSKEITYSSIEKASFKHLSSKHIGYSDSSFEFFWHNEYTDDKWIHF